MAVTFDSQTVISVAADGARSVFAADLDRDGDLDLLSASRSDNKIAWYENTGGTFGPQQIISTATNSAESVYAADIDSDGNIDVLSASRFDEKIAWYRNLGNGSFGVQQIISSSADDAREVFAADIDNDGDLDVLSASFGDDEIAWYANNGAGIFGPKQLISNSADGAQSVYAADLDNDGDLDVLSASDNDDKIAWYENNGGGIFGGGEYIISIAADRAQSVFAADLDRDGDLDVLSASFSEDKIAWYQNNGNGGFGAQQIISSNADGAGSVYATDLDNDGDLDVISASENDDKIAWYENNGSGSFGTEQVISTAANGVRSVVAVDLDNDGDTDVFSASQIDNKIAWYENTTPGVNLSPSTETTVSTAASSAQSVYAADLDNDGDLDLLSASISDDKVAWYENIGGGSFGAQQIISSTADAAISVYAADLDNDGDLDVISASFLNDRISWYENFGGSFGNEQVISTAANGPTSVFAADIDSDGDMDVLSASTIDDRIAWFENLGGGSFSAIDVISNSADRAQSVFAGDLDNDGDLDVLSASRGDNKIAWYRNNGVGSFSTQIISTSLDGARSVYAADLDNDGDLDVVAAALLGDRIVWYENNGSGSFSSEQIISTTVDGPQSVYAADMDNDGDLDVVAGSFADDKVAWYENNGSGSFGSEVIISRNADAPFSVYAADIDNDGDLDVLSASSFDNKIAWYENAPVTRIVSSGSPAEAGAASGTFTFSRGSATQGNVTLAFTVAGSATTGDDYTAVGADTFAAGSGTVTIPDGSRTVNITIVPVDDSVIDASETVELALVDGSGYTVSTINNSANLAIADNDSAGITITQSGGNTNVTEGGATDTYDISLDTIPSNPVTISISPDAQTDLGAGAGTAIALNFATDATALTPQTVTVTATDDAIAEGSHFSTIGHSVVSADVNYNGFSLANIGATITDNDSPGVSISQSGGNTNLTEGGASDSYDLVLTTQPSADVTINLATAGQVITSSSSLTFTSANWNQPQTVTVAATNDAVAEGNHTGTIGHSSSSTDPNYDGIAIANLLVNITDDDSAGISIAVSGGSTEVSEGGNTDTYTIVLTAAPTAPVTVSFNPGSDLESIAPLTFDPTNWNIAQTVTVRATDDGVAEGNHNSTIAHSATSTDGNYSGIAIASVSVQIADNDNAGVSILQTEGSTQIAEGGATDTYSVVLTAAPTAPVSIRFNTDSQVEAIADLTFTPNNWNISQTVTVTAREDSIDESLHSSTIGHQSLSLDTNYNGIAIGNVFVAIADNDAATPEQPNPEQPNPEQPLQSPFPPSLPVQEIAEAEVPAGVIVTEPAGSMELFEGVGTELYKVRLFSQPTEDVAIAITTDAQISTDIQTLTFTSSNWQIPQTVKVVAVDDSANEGSHSGRLIHTASSGDRRYDQIAIDNIVANIVDNDNFDAENNLATSSILRFSESNDRVIGSPARDVIHGGAGNDYLDGAEGDDFIFGQLGNDVSLGREGDDQIAGNEGNDYLQGNLGSDRISGGAGNDRVRGGSGDDLLFGDSGSDRLFGDRGADTLLGGLDNDAFAIGSGTGGQTLDRADVIADFTKGQDTILLTGALTFDRLSILPGTGANADSAIIRDLATGEYLAILQSVLVDNLDSGDFV